MNKIEYRLFNDLGFCDCVFLSKDDKNAIRTAKKLIQYDGIGYELRNMETKKSYFIDRRNKKLKVR